MDLEAKVVRVGAWLYDGIVETSVRIVRQNWDCYHEEGFSDEPPDLNAEGHAFYAVFGAPLPPEPGSQLQELRYPSRSRSCLSLEEAVALAEATVGGSIAWGRLPHGER
jgi:hypothetical protein